jgi:hypothetical protein
MFKWINGIKCLVKYKVVQEEGKTICIISVYSKIHSKPLEIILDDIDEVEGFNPRATIRKLRINIAQGEGDQPFLDLYEDLDDVYVDTYSDYVYFMMPAHIISYVYGSNCRYVTFSIQNTEQNFLQCNILDPVSLMEQNKNSSARNDKETKEAFQKTIDPARLFKYLNNFDMNGSEYEATLNPVRYRHVLI